MPVSKINYLKLTENQEKYNLLTDLEQYFISQLNLTPVFGAELEFYLSPDISAKKLENSTGITIKEEKGESQYEIDLGPMMGASNIAKAVNAARQEIINAANDLGGEADFLSKPKEHDYGSSMHIHLNFLEDNNIEKYAQILCASCKDYLDFFLSSADDYKRLDSNFMAPTHISWGGNNRTTLIRIPDSRPKHIEHRLAGASSCPARVIYAMLDSIKSNLVGETNIKAIPKTHGNAFDPQYNLEKIL